MGLERAKGAMNTKVGKPSNSMRIDIPKDNVLAAAQQDDGEKYQVTGFLDPAPPTKLVEEMLGRKGARSSACVPCYGSSLWPHSGQALWLSGLQHGAEKQRQCALDPDDYPIGARLK